MKYLAMKNLNIQLEIKINPNCGGGVGIFVDERYKDYEILKGGISFHTSCV